MKKLSIFFFSLFLLSISSQENVKYQKPSKEILDLVEFERPPSIVYDDNKNFMLLCGFEKFSNFYVRI